MNEVNFINYLLLAFFVAGTYYVVLIVAKEVRDDLLRYFKPLKRLFRRYLSRRMHEASSVFRIFSVRAVS